MYILYATEFRHHYVYKCNSAPTIFNAFSFYIPLKNIFQLINNIPHGLRIIINVLFDFGDLSSEWSQFVHRKFRNN